MRVRDRRLHWPNCRNARDLGGLGTTDGRRIRRGALIRADTLERLNPEGVAALRAYGVRRVIDLRTEGEAARFPGPFTGDEIYRLAPLIDRQAERGRNPAAETTLLATYCASVDRNARSIAAGLAAVADAPSGGVVVHCYAGKDRTGMHVALALRAAGVALDEIAADYALTNECLRDLLADELASFPDAAEREEWLEQQSCTAETIVGMLEYVEDRYGSVVGYLTEIGLTDGQIGALRARLLID